MCQADARGAARCALHVHGRGAKADSTGCSFAVLSTQVSTFGLRLRYSRLACGSMLEVSRDAVAAGDEELTNRTAESPCGDLPFTSWDRWQCLRGGADEGLNSWYAACGCGTEHRCGALPGGRRVATCLGRWCALNPRSPTRRWHALPLAVERFQWRTQKFTRPNKCYPCGDLPLTSLGRWQCR
jgi:hypothetical protein